MTWLPKPLSQKARRVILHIGAPKAGSTAIQSMLGRNRKLLAAQGILLPTLGSGGTACPLVPLFVPWPRTTTLHRRFNVSGFPMRRGYRRPLMEKLSRELQSARPETVILSSENFYQHLSGKRSLSQLRAFLREIADEITVIGWFRRQDLAMFSSQIHSARVGGNALFLPPASVSANHWLRYAERLDGWSEVFHGDELIVRPFESQRLQERDVCRDFIIRARLVLDNIETGIAANVGLDLVVATFLERLNEHIPRDIGNKVNPTFTAIAATFGLISQKSPRPVISSADSRHILEMFRESNERLSSRFGEGRPFFNESVRDHDPLAEDGLTASDAVAISADIFAALAEKLNLLQAVNDKLRARIAKLIPSDANANR